MIRGVVLAKDELDLVRTAAKLSATGGNTVTLTRSLAPAGDKPGPLDRVRMGDLLWVKEDFRTYSGRRKRHQMVTEYAVEGLGSAGRAGLLCHTPGGWKISGHIYAAQMVRAESRFTLEVVGVARVRGEKWDGGDSPVPLAAITIRARVHGRCILEIEKELAASASKMVVGA